MQIKQAIEDYASDIGAELTGDNGLYKLKLALGSRKAMGSKQSVSYSAKFRIDDDKKLIKFSEMVKEVSSGLGVGGDMPPGLNFKKETIKSGPSGLEGNVSVKSNLAGQSLEYQFNYKEIRQKMTDLAKDHGYKFKYKIFPWGL